MVIAAGGSDRPAAAATGVAGVIVVTAAVSGVATTGTPAVVVATAAAAAAATALSFSAVAFSVPVAMHLSRYGRLPSWNKSRTQCLVIFHSSTMKEILAMAICYVIFLFPHSNVFYIKFNFLL
jgi:hypothetical protein